MRYPTGSGMLLLLLVACLPATGSSQEGPASVQHREGFWIGFGFGPSYLSVGCDACETTGSDDPWGSGVGGSLWLSMGGTLSPSVLLGGRLNLTDLGILAGGDGSDHASTIGSLLVIARYYPRPTSGLHLKGGLGFGGAGLADGDRDVVTTDGLALHGGLGHDFRFGGWFGLTPFLDAGMVLSSEATGMFEGRLVGVRGRPWYAHAGLGFTWY